MIDTLLLFLFLFDLLSISGAEWKIEGLSWWVCDFTEVYQQSAVFETLRKTKTSSDGEWRDLFHSAASACSAASCCCLSNLQNEAQCRPLQETVPADSEAGCVFTPLFPD